jgi:hypothetical protein
MMWNPEDEQRRVAPCPRGTAAAKRRVGTLRFAHATADYDVSMPFTSALALPKSIRPA